MTIRTLLPPARPFEPAYVRLLESGALDERARIAYAHLERCDLCPRRCGVDRRRSARGAACRSGERARSLEALALLEGVVDIYMPDVKYSDEDLGRRCSRVRDYVAANRAAVREMHRQVGDLVVDADGIARRGLLVRHLVLPNGVSGTEEVLPFLAEEISTNTYVNLMDQYRPCYRASEYPAVARRPTAAELRAAAGAAARAGLRRLDPGSARAR